MFKALIIDDERLARSVMARLSLAHTDSIELIGEASTAKEALASIESLKPDLLFLDIQLPDRTGLELLEDISYQPRIIFTTAYKEYAIEAFEKLSVDYLLKPITQERFDKAIAKLKEFTKRDNAIDLAELKTFIANKSALKRNTLAIKKKTKIILLDFEDITYCKAEDKYVTVHLKNGQEHLYEKSLSELETKLSDDFIRVHRSYVVNRTSILQIEKHFHGNLVLQLNDLNNSSVKTGETYVKSVKEAIGL